MIVIETNKIATRQWCKDTFGNGSVVYTGNTSTLPECIHAADVNQSNTKIVLPSNDNNGAIPSSYLPDSDKCLTQDVVSKLYQHITINPTFYITKSATGSTLTSYKATLNITYYNKVKASAVYPGLYGITSNNMPTVTVDISRYDKNIILTTPLASTTLSGITLPLATQLTSSSFVDGDVFANSYNTLVTTPTGSIDYTAFFQSYIADMYKYFNGETSDAKYVITASIMPSAYIRTSSIFAPIYYDLSDVSVIANTSSSSSTNNAKANITYNCTSETIENSYTVYAFTITVSNKNAGTSSNLVTVSSDKGSLSISSNTGTTTQTILGTVRYAKTSSSDVPPFVTIKYAPSGYTPYYSKFPANTQGGLGIV